jgi:predicted small secreted protein
MRTRVFLGLVILASLLVAGCNTAKGVGVGVGTTVVGTAKGAGDDAVDTWAFLKKTDAWMRKNLW